VSAPHEHDVAPTGKPDEGEALAGHTAEGEVVDGVPVLEQQWPRIVPISARAGSEPAKRRPAASSPAVQAAAAAAGGFVAGAALLGLVQRRQRRASALARAQRPARLLGRRGGQPAAVGVTELVQVVATRSLLVDVHLLAGPSAPPSH